MIGMAVGSSMRSRTTTSVVKTHGLSMRTFDAVEAATVWAQSGLAAT
jgi:hypothetical protein